MMDAYPFHSRLEPDDLTLYAVEDTLTFDSPPEAMQPLALPAVPAGSHLSIFVRDAALVRTLLAKPPVARYPVLLDLLYSGGLYQFLEWLRNSTGPYQFEVRDDRELHQTLADIETAIERAWSLQLQRLNAAQQQRHAAEHRATQASRPPARSPDRDGTVTARMELTNGQFRVLQLLTTVGKDQRQRMLDYRVDGHRREAAICT